MQETPKQKGRKPKEGPTGYGPLTVRLPDKTRFALELLAKVQGRSLSQAVEWALNVGVRAQRVISSTERETSVADLSERIWPMSLPARTLELYQTAPHLVDFEDRCISELVDSCQEFQKFAVWIKNADREDREERERKIRRVQALYQFIFDNWDMIKRAAVRRSESGESLREQDLSDFLLSEPDTVDIGIAMHRQFPELEQ